MAMIERDVVLVGKDANGNTTVDLPITRLGNLEDTAEIKNVPVSGDALAIVDSEAQGEVKKISWADVMHAVKDAVGGGDGSALEELKQALDEHEADGGKHISGGERAAWDNAKEKMDAHAADDVAHVTAQEREKWNNAGGGGAKVGDILYSSRRDLGDKWALCNGDLVDPEEYPELDAVLPENDEDESDMVSVGINNGPARITWIEGFWVGLRFVMSGSTVNEVLLVYSKTPDGPWAQTRFEVKKAYNQGLNENTKLTRQGECWVIHCNNSDGAVMYYNQGDLFTGEWLETSKLNVHADNLYYFDGWWVAGSGYYWYKHEGDTPKGNWERLSLQSDVVDSVELMDGVVAFMRISSSLCYIGDGINDSFKRLTFEFDRDGSNYGEAKSYVRMGDRILFLGYTGSSYYYATIWAVSTEDLKTAMEQGLTTIEVPVLRKWIGTEWKMNNGSSVRIYCADIKPTGPDGKEKTYIRILRADVEKYEFFWITEDEVDFTASSEDEYETERANVLTHEGHQVNALWGTLYRAVWRRVPEIMLENEYAYIKVKE